MGEIDVKEAIALILYHFSRLNAKVTFQKGNSPIYLISGGFAWKWIGKAFLIRTFLFECCLFNISYDFLDEQMAFL